MFWLPPGRFSTTTGCGQTPCRPCGDGARDGVGRAAGRERHDDPTGPLGKALRCSKCREQREEPSQQPSPLEFPPRRFAPPSLPIRTARRYDGLSQGGAPLMLTPEELDKLSGAESLFPSPIPVQFVSSDEFMPSPQIAAAEGVRGAHQGHRREAREEARHDAPQVLQDRRRHGRGVRRDERGLREGRRSRSTRC